MNKSKAKGTAGEVRVRDGYRDRGFPYAERLALNGSVDRGDITGVPGVMSEVKNEKEIRLAAYMDEVQIQKTNAGVPIGVAIIPRRGKAIGKAYVVMEFDQFCEMIRD